MAAAAARALARGVADAGWRARCVPVADGGDGTLDVLLAAAGASARVQRVRVSGRLWKKFLISWSMEMLLAQPAED